MIHWKNRYKKIIDGFGFEQEENNYKLYRIYLLISAALAPLFIFVFFSYSYERILWIDVLIPVVYTVLLFCSFVYKGIRNNIQHIFFYVNAVFTLYAFYLFRGSGFTFEGAFGYILIVAGILIGVQNHFYSVGYLLYNSILILVSTTETTNTGIEYYYVLAIVIIIGVACFIIHYNRHLLLEKLKNNRSEIEESGDRLLTVINSIDSLVYNVEIDENGNRVIRFISAQVEKILGLTPDEYITVVKSGRLLNQVHPDDFLHILEKSKELNTTKKPVSLAYRFKKGDKYIWLEEKVYPKVINGKHVANIGISTDVTSRKETEIALVKSEQKNRTTIERNLAGFFRIDMNGTITECNDSFAGIFGFTDKREAEGKKIYEIYDDSTDKNIYLDLLKREVLIRNHESRIKRKDGKIIWTLENVALISEGRDIFIEGTVIDITEQKNAQMEKQRVEENLTLVINNIDNLVYSVDINGEGKKEVNFLGDQVEEILGMDKQDYTEELKSGNIEKYFHPEDLMDIQKKYSEEKEKKGVKKFTYRFWSKRKAAYVWLEEDMFPQYNEQGVLYKNFGVVRDVTEKIKFEQALRKSEEKYRLLFERNKAGVFKTTLDGRILECNQAFLDIFGYESKEEVMERKSYELYYSPYDRERYLGQLKQQRRLTNYELRQKKKDGNSIWVLVNVTLVYDDSENEEVLLGTLADITEQKLTSDALLESEQKFRLLFEVANDGIFILEPETFSITHCNTRAAEMFGLPVIKIIGKSLVELSPSLQPDGEPSLHKLKIRSREITHEKPQLFYWRATSADNLFFDSELSLNLFDLSGKPYIQAIMRDVTSRMKAEHAVRESEERFKLLADSTLEGILFTEGEKIIDANDQFAIIHGFSSRKDIIGKKTFDFFKPCTNGDLNSEIQSVTASGENIWLESKEKHLPFGSRQVKVMAVYNITDRKKYEQEIIKSKQAYEQLVEESPYGIFIHRDGKIIYANNAAFDILNISRKEFREEKYSIYDFLLPQYVDESKLRREAVLKGQQVPFIRIQIRDVKGNVLDIESKSHLINYQGEKAIQTTIKNISTELLLEKEKLRAEMAEQTNKTLEQEISERKKAQEKLQEIQQYTQNIINSSLDMIMATNNNNQINEVNNAAEKIFGYRREELLGKTPEVLYADKQDYERVKKELDTKGFFTGEIINVNKKGKTFTSFLSASIIKNNKGEQVGVMGVSRDITEIKEAETLIRQSEERYRDLFENATDIIQSVAMDGRFIYVNNSWSDALEYSPEEALSMNVFQVIAPEEQEHCKAVFSELIQGKTMQADISTTFMSKSGKRIFVEGTTNLKLENGKPFSTRSIFRNTTETKAAQRKAFENAARIRSVFENSSSLLMWTLDKNLKITSFNHNFFDTIQKHLGIEMTMGYDFGKDLKHYIPPEDYESTLVKYEAALSGTPQELEGTIITRDKEFIWFETFLNPIVLENGRIEEISCISHDITGKKQGEEEIRQSLKEKEVLLKEVHHRVKNNLQVISSILNLQSSYVKNEKILQVLRESQNRIKSMSFIHESLYQNKTFSYINFSEYIVNLSKNLVHSYQLFGQPVELVFEVKEVKLNIDQAIPCGLIVNELVSNALKYAFEEKHKGVITVKLAEKGKRVTIKIEDNGKGLPKGFDHNNTETLGLQLVVTLVEQLEGKLKVKSEKGTKYLITFDKIN